MRSRGGEVGGERGQGEEKARGGEVGEEKAGGGEGRGEVRACYDGFNLRIAAFTPVHNMTDMAIIFVLIAQPQQLESAT